jgi:coenzyme F420 hydrogenase subunit beta
VPELLAKNLESVIENDLCVGCGACTAADPSIRLRLHPVKQIYEPNGVGNQQAAQVCPAVQVDFELLHKQLFEGEQLTPFGVVDGVYLAQSRDRERNLRASSGGIIKELLIDWLERHQIDGVIAVRHLDGIRYEPALSTTPEQVAALPGSIYHSLDFSAALRLLEENDGRFALVATPCQLEGLLQYILLQAPGLRQRLHTTVGLVCGWTYTHHALRAICSFKGVDFDSLCDVSYRGGGPVGPLRLVTSSGERKVNRRVDLDYQVAFDRSFNLRRCHLCINHANFLADIVVADAWLPSTVRSKTGISLVISRRRRCTQDLQRLGAAARVALTEVGLAEVEESLTRRVAYGDMAYAYAEYLASEGRYQPQMVGPNRPRAALPPRAEVAQFDAVLQKKVSWQRRQFYHSLRVRKLTVELGPFLYRYLRWFGVRVLKIKSLLGLRQEVQHDKLIAFR